MAAENGHSGATQCGEFKPFHPMAHLSDMEHRIAALLVICLWAVASVGGWLDGHPFACATVTSGHSNLSATTRIMLNMDATTSPARDDSASDAALVQQAASGDRAAYAGLYQRHAGWLLPLLWRFSGGDRGKAEDLLQDAFVHAWSRLEQLREPAQFRGWLRQLAINLALADRRRLKVAGTDDGLGNLSELEPPWPASDIDLERAIAELPDRARQVLVLFCMEGYSHEEIAVALDIHTGTSKAQLHRARSLLKETLS
jgi:DNA-directed RNA polymerase specialized sigma24 family protein